MVEPRADGRAFIVGDAETITWADLYSPIATAFGRTLAEISVPPPTRPNWIWPPLDTVRLLRGAVGRLPPRPRRALRAAISELRGPKRMSNPGQTVSEERALLHTCRVRLPMEWARRELGYEPIVDFPTASRHAVSWLAFAGYPVAIPPSTSVDRSG